MGDGARCWLEEKEAARLIRRNLTTDSPVPAGGQGKQEGPGANRGHSLVGLTIQAISGRS